MLYYNEFEEDLTEEELQNRRRYNLMLALAMYNAFHR